MSAFQIISLLITAAALLSFVTYRFFRVPVTVGITMLSLATSLVLLMFGKLAGEGQWARSAMLQLDFNQIVLHGMLAFLLFAGALGLDVTDLRRHRLTVLALSIAGTAISTLIVGGLTWALFHALHFNLPLRACLLFGALISPTDPIAVLAIIQKLGVPHSIQTQLSGEALFNDGVGAVFFITLLEASQGGCLPGPGHVLKLLLLEAGGGLALGLLAGLLFNRLLAMVEDYQTEILMTLALAMGGYALADALHVSAPLEAVTAGLCLAGGHGAKAISAGARDYLDKFWELVDGILNAVLFLLLGLELLVLPLDSRYLLAGAIAVPVVLLARLLSVAGVLLPLRWKSRETLRAEIGILTWGGLRGGLSIALALSLPLDGSRDLLLAVTYIVVIFALVVQSLTVEPLAITLLQERRQTVVL